MTKWNIIFFRCFSSFSRHSRCTRVIIRPVITRCCVFTILFFFFFFFWPKCPLNTIKYTICYCKTYALSLMSIVSSHRRSDGDVCRIKKIPPVRGECCTVIVIGILENVFTFLFLRNEFRTGFASKIKKKRRSRPRRGL